MATVSSGGNFIVFNAITAGSTATLDFEDAVKRVMFDADICITNTDKDELFTAKAGTVIEFSNIFGYPAKVPVKNTGNAGMIPRVCILEYGDAVNDDYFEEA